MQNHNTKNMFFKNNNNNWFIKNKEKTYLNGRTLNIEDYSEKIEFGKPDKYNFIWILLKCINKKESEFLPYNIPSKEDSFFCRECQEIHNLNECDH